MEARMSLPRRTTQPGYRTLRPPNKNSKKMPNRSCHVALEAAAPPLTLLPLLAPAAPVAPAAAGPIGFRPRFFVPPAIVRTGIDFLTASIRSRH